MLNIQIRGDKALRDKFNRTADPNRVLAGAVTKLTLQLEAKIKEKLSNQVLKVQTGNLRRSIHSVLPVEVSSGTVTGRVGQSGDVKYGAIHEFGGTINHPGGTPYMSFQGQTFFVSLQNAKNLNLPVTKAHAILMPERSFMRSSLAEMAPIARDELQRAIKKALQ